MAPPWLHNFSREGLDLAIDLRSLTLYKVESQSTWPWARSRYIPVSATLPRERDLDEERRCFLSTNQLSRGYCYLNISHACNLKCAYCFADGGAYGGPQVLMNIELARQAVDWILKSNKNSNQIVFNLFGGEPLVNASTMYETIEYAACQCQALDQDLSIILSTNGTIELIEVGEVLQSIHHWIAVSLDGGVSLQNLNRPFRNGKGSYDIIAKNVRSYINRFGPSKISARATWRRGQSNLVESVQSLLELGVRNVSIGRETAFGGDSQQPKNVDGIRDFDEILVGYDALAKWYVQTLNGGQGIVVQPLKSIMCGILQSRITRYRCTAGINKWCVVPDGSVYPCHRFVGDERFNIGHVSMASSTVELSSDLTSSTLPQDCESCWGRYWCFSDNCTYLTAIGKDLRRLNGFCDHMCSFIEMICFHVANLSEDGRNNLLTT